MSGPEDVPPPPPPQAPQSQPQQVPHTMSTVKLPLLKKGEYDIWAMKMEHYLAHTDYPIWEGIDDLSFDDLYNNLRVFESDIQGSNVSSSSSPNVAFDSSDNTNSTNNVSTASGDSSSSSHNNTKRETSSSYTDDLMYSFFANQSSGLQLDHEDLEQINEYDLEEMDLKWKLAMISMRLKKFYKKTGRKLHFDAKEPVGFDKTKVECYNCHKTGHFARECRFKGSTYTRRREGGSFGYKVKDNAHADDEDEDFALMAFNNASSDTEVISCSPKCVESYSKLKKLYDEQRYQLSDANVEILAYSQGLKKVEAQLVTHQNNQLWYEQKISKLLNTKMSASDKFGLGYGDYKFDGILSYENEVLQSMFFNNESNSDDSTLNVRFAKPDGMHAVPPPMIGNYMPSGPDVEIDESQYTYGPKQPHTSESDTRTIDFDSCESNSSEPTTNHMPVPIVIEPIVVGTPKVWTDAPIIEEYESDDECVSTPPSDQQKPREHVQENKTSNEIPKVNKKDLHGFRSRMGLGCGRTRMGCYVYGSLSHLIRDCDFHEKRMARQAAMHKRVSKDTHQKEKRSNGNNVQQVNHKNQFVPSAVLTRSGKIPYNIARSSSTNHLNTARQNVSTARQNCPTVPTRTARKVSTVSTNMNDFKPKSIFHNDHSPTKRPLSKTAALKDKFSNSKVNTAKGKAVSAAEGKGTTAVKASAGCIWRTKQYFDYPQRTLKNKGIVDSGCSRHMTGNKGYLVDYQDFNGGPVAFGGSKGQITGKGKIRTGKLDFDDVCFVKELQQFNLFSVSQMYDKKNKVLFTDTECLVLSPDFKLPDENQVLLRVPRQHKMYRFNLENFAPSKGLTCLIAKATSDESNKWHRRLGHVNFKNLNKLVKGNLVREFKNRDMIELCGSKGIKREYSNARTPQQNGVAKRKNRTLIEAARTMLADSFLTNTFWAEAVSTACYVLNRVLVTKPHNKNPYELITGKQPIISYIRPFGCHVTILNTLDHLGKFKEKADEDFLVGYSLSRKGPTWLFDLDYLTDSMNYQPVTAENRANKPTGPEEANHNAGTKDSSVAVTADLNDESTLEYYRNEDPEEQVDQDFLDELEQLKRQEKAASDAAEALRKDFALGIEDLLHQAGASKADSTNKVSTDGPSLSTDSLLFSTDGPLVSTASLRISIVAPHPSEDDSKIPPLEDIYDNTGEGIFTSASFDDEGAVADFTNLESTVNVSPIPTSRIHTIHPTTQILGDPASAQRRNNHKDFQHCLFACFLSQVEPKKISDALEDESWVNAMQEELMQFKIQKVWILVDLPKGKKTIRLKWVYRNKKDERGVVVRNKARLVAQGHRQEESIDYDEVFAPVARIEAIRIFLAFASYMGFIVYQMDVKSAFLYGTIDEEVYVTQPPGFIDPMYPKKVYKVVKALYGLHQAPRAWYATLSTFLLQNRYKRGAIDKTLFIKKDKKNIILVQVYVDDIFFGSTKKSWCDEFKALMKSKFQMSSMGELTFFLGLQVKQKEDGIFISQDKYVAKILKKFDFMNVKTASTLIETQRPLTKDTEATDVDVHLYRSMIGSLMYLTASRPDIMFAVCNCSRFQVTPKTSHLNAVKRIFRYLKGKSNLGLWYPRVSPFDLEAYSDSDYAGANLYRKSTTGGCQFLGRRLISWQCKKQTIVATSTTEAEYVAAASCCGQVLWIQNQMLDYGFNFMNTRIHIDNEITICIVKNPVFHSKTKHIEIMHHFIRDAYEKKLIQVLKIHTDNNVADLLTKAFDAGRFQFLIVSIGMMNP
ncbi:putative ribonuclease H-like domain-containing protein [Tanacetum coccineum]